MNEPLNHSIRFNRDRSGAQRIPTLSPGLYTGVVLNTSRPNNLITVGLEAPNNPVVECIWANGIISGLLGFKLSYLPPVKTRVIVMIQHAGSHFILGSFPYDLNDPGADDRSITDPGAEPYHNSETCAARRNDASKMVNDQKFPTDMIEGELDLSNLMGVGISLLSGLASLQGSDRARVECHLIDDMVRVISRTFRHHSAFGDADIYNDGGRLNVEWHGSAFDHEAFGNLKSSDPRVKQSADDQVSFEEQDIEGFNEDGRWRFSQYIGWLGDFINIFVTDPVSSLGGLASDKLRSGKARMHVNSDGSILFQSVADIVLEKVVRIRVPVKKRRPEDPRGNRTDDGPRSSEFVKTWRPTSENLFEMAYQLREYSRWLSGTYSLSRFHTMDRDFDVPSESSTPAPDIDCAEPLKAEENIEDNQDVQNWQLAYSTIRIFRDGSVQTVDAYGNSILTTKHGIQISSTQDLILQAAGSVNIVAGRDINVLAQKNVGITSVKESVRIKSEKAFQILVNAGNFVVELIGDAVMKLIGKFNANDTVSIDKNGDVNTVLGVTANQLFASVTKFDHHGDGHIFPGIPFVESVDSEFKFQDDYGDVPQYETFAQTALNRNEQPSSGDWDFSGNAVSGKGAPWPGEDPKHMAPIGGTNLNTPSSENQAASSEGLEEKAVTMKTQ